MKLNYLIATMIATMIAAPATADSCIENYIKDMDKLATVDGGMIESCDAKMKPQALATCKALIGQTDPIKIAVAVISAAATSCKSAFTDADKSANAGDVSCKNLDFSTAIAHVKDNKDAQAWCTAGANALSGKVSAKFAGNCGCDGKSTAAPFQVKIIGGN